MTNIDERAEFEKVIREIMPTAPLQRLCSGYADATIDGAYTGWQARARLSTEGNQEIDPVADMADALGKYQDKKLLEVAIGGAVMGAGGSDGIMPTIPFYHVKNTLAEKDAEIDRLKGACSVLARVHLRDDDVTGYVVQLGAIPEYLYNSVPHKVYIEAWGIIHKALAAAQQGGLDE